MFNNRRFLTKGVCEGERAILRCFGRGYAIIDIYTLRILIVYHIHCFTECNAVFHKPF